MISGYNSPHYKDKILYIEDGSNTVDNFPALELELKPQGRTTSNNQILNRSIFWVNVYYFLLYKCCCPEILVLILTLSIVSLNT